MFSVVWQYLTGVSRAADFSDQSRPEWPPHPDRVFQALVASWAARGCSEAERETLLWLESLDPPSICATEAVSVESTPGVYVPPNGIEVPVSRRNGGPYVSSYVGIIPEKRKQRLRYNAQVWVGDGLCALSWPTVDQEEFADHQQTLASLCAGVTRIGRSSSFVACWVSSQSFPAVFQPAAEYSPGSRLFRVSRPGRLGRLEKACENEQRPPRAAEIPYENLKTRPTAPFAESTTNPFSPDPVILRIVSNDFIPLSATLSVTRALRGRLISAASRFEPSILPLVSGHAGDGSPLRSAHIAYVPLPFVGSTWADGRILALALFLPKSLDRDGQDRLYRLLAALVDDNGIVTLTEPDQGTITLDTSPATSPARTLQRRSWTHSSHHWASVTPVVMNRMQNRMRSSPDRWAAIEIERMLVESGFPQPVSVTVTPVSRHRGALAVFDAPPILRKDRRVRRMVHIDVQFPSEVAGPLIIGSGRYRGYGLCKPVYHRSRSC